MATISRAKAEALRIAKSRQNMRKLAIVGVVFPLLVAAWGSYWHIVDSVARFEHNWLTVHIWPLAPDGGMLVCAVAIIYQATSGWSPAKAMFWACFGISFVANLMSSNFSLGGVFFAVSPPLMMMGTAEVLLRMFIPPKKKARRRPATRPAQRTEKAPAGRRHSATPARGLQAVAGR